MGDLRIRVIAVAPSLNPTDGWATIPANVCPELAREHDLTVLVGEATDEKFADRYDFPVLDVLPTPTEASHPVKALKLGYTLRKYVSDVDAVHSFITYPYLPATALALLGRDVPLTATALGTYAVRPLQVTWRRPLLTFGYRQADTVLCTSDYTKSRIQAEVDGVNTTVRIAAGVDLDRFGTDPPRDEGYVLSVGAIKERKGQDVLTEAFARVIDEFPDVDLRFVGPTQDQTVRDCMTATIEDHDLADRVHFEGFVSDRDRLAELYRDCTLFALTPRVVDDNFEGGPVVFFEAGAFSKASLSTDAGGADSAVLHEETGLIAEAENVEAVATQLRRLLDDESLRERLEKQARERVEANTWASYAERLNEEWVRLRAVTGG